MEFNEKLQKLRRQKGLTQEALAESLYVSRTAVSKWESGRGYPNIESLKVISKFFGVTIDELLTEDEFLTAAEDSADSKAKHFRDLLYGLLDCSCILLFFLPFFGERTDTAIRASSLISLEGISFYLKCAFFAAAVGMIGAGILALALQNCRSTFWMKYKNTLSFGMNLPVVILFTVSRQPYAAIFLFVLLVIKVLIASKTAMIR